MTAQIKDQTCFGNYIKARNRELSTLEKVNNFRPIQYLMTRAERTVILLVEEKSFSSNE